MDLWGGQLQYTPTAWWRGRMDTFGTPKRIEVMIYSNTYIPYRGMEMPFVY